MDILTAGIKKGSEEAHEIVQLTEWIEQTLPMCIEQLELQMAARNSFPDSSEARRDFLMNYIWKRTSPLHKNYIDRYGHNYLYYDFAHSNRPAVKHRLAESI